MKKLTLREQQLVVLDILKYFDKICKEHNIQYSLGAGTLLGAVRHKGFIPWDDDIDLYMHRKEYLKFVQIYKQNYLNNPDFQASFLDDYEGCNPAEMSKIFMTKSKIIDDHNEESKIFLDIFIYDALPDDINDTKKMMKKFNCIKSKFSSLKKRYKRTPKGTLLNKIYYKSSQFLLKKLFSFLNNFFEKNKLEDAKYIGLAPSDATIWWKSIMPKEYFNDIVYLEFEGGMYPCMNGHKEYLTIFYGDYMQLPPKEERSPKHSSIAYLIE